MKLGEFSIGHHITMAFVTFLVVAVGVVMLLSNRFERHAVEDLARQDAREMSQMVFLSLYSSMRKGWDKSDIRRVIEEYDRIKPGLDVDVIRGGPVVRQYGDTEFAQRERGSDLQVRKVLAHGEEFFEYADDRIKYLYPLVVKAECLGCHQTATVGEVNGVVRVSYPVSDVKISLNFVQKVVVTGVAVLVALLAMLFSIQLRFLVARPISRIVSEIGRISETRNLDTPISERGLILEIQKLANHFNAMLKSLREHSDTLEFVRAKDSLTGLLNRTSFLDYLGEATGRVGQEIECFAVIMVDLDHFQAINSRYGYHVGDLVLSEMAELLRSNFRGAAAVGRIGGDSFAICLENDPVDEVFKQALVLRGVVADADFGVAGLDGGLSASIGVVSFPDDAGSYEEFLDTMEFSVQKARQAGPERVARVAADELKDRASGSNRLEVLKAALRHREIEVKLEPIVDVGADHVYACESLARLRVGDDLLSAGLFIEEAERAGLATNLDLAVIDRTLDVMSRDSDDRTVMFFNLSPRTICSDVSMRRVFTMVEDYAVDPSRVVFEITEREAIPRFNRIRRIVAEAKSAGYRFALDDFGSGFSSLLYLKHLNVDFVKIDGALVRDMQSSWQEVAMVRHINGLVHELGLKTIAEYVENETLFGQLQELGVDYAQGYLFADREADRVPTRKLG